MFFNIDNRVIDQVTNGNGNTAQCHRVDSNPEDVKDDDRQKDRQRHGCQ